MNPLIEPLMFLLGEWKGVGQGLWSADPVFRYREKAEFTHQGGPFVTYRQTTSSLDGSRTLHAETGYLRPLPDGSLELVLAQPTGLVEVHTGTVVGYRIALRSVGIGRTPTALEVTDVARVIEVRDDALTYQLELAMHREQLAPHLAGRLQRVATEDAPGAFA
ncbi:MAG: heme-binding beta-barrel domain-containing protein [Acidimicrobiales bacterium]